jgi:secondary thiamine-phosphate synthase enzyme
MPFSVSHAKDRLYTERESTSSLVKEKVTTYSTEIQLETKGEPDVVDVTQQVEARVKSSGVRQGLVTVFCPASTAAITTMEYEPGLVKDLPVALERLAPRKATYQHQLRWQDDNGHSHVRAALMGPSITLPIVDGSLPLGQWQQIIFVELDVRARQRRLIIQVVGD